VKTEKKVGELRGDVGDTLIGHDALFQKTPIFTPKNELFIQEMHLRIPF
jgi:hypothetical protein